MGNDLDCFIRAVACAGPAVATAVGTAVPTAVATAVATTGPAPVTALRKHSKRLPTGVIHLIGQYICSETAHFVFRNGTDVDISVPIC